MPLTACFASTPSGGPAIVAETARLDRALTQQKPPAEDLRPCADPVVIPRGLRLGAGPVERLWRRDRLALVECGARKAAVQQFYDDRDAGVAAAAK